jgi:hypothetical protein
MFWEAFFVGNADTLWTNALPIETARKPDLAIINGDGAMIYPGEFVLNTKRPIPGYRLKLIRRAQQDYEYLYLLSLLTGSKAASDSIAGSILNKALWDAVAKETEDWERHKKGLIDPEFNYMKGHWSHNPDDWNKARMALLDAIIAKI